MLNWLKILFSRSKQNENFLIKQKKKQENEYQNGSLNWGWEIYIFSFDNLSYINMNVRDQFVF